MNETRYYLDEMGRVYSIGAMGDYVCNGAEPWNELWEAQDYRLVDGEWIFDPIILEE